MLWNITAEYRIHDAITFFALCETYLVNCLVLGWLIDWFIVLNATLSVLLQYMNSDCPFGIFKIFLHVSIMPLSSPRQGPGASMSQGVGFSHSSYKPITNMAWEEQTTQWAKEKVQKNNQRSTKHTYKTKDRVTRTPLKTGGEISCSGRVCSSCSTSGTRRFNLVTNPVTSRESAYSCRHISTSIHTSIDIQKTKWGIITYLS
jgi:hypothetical protein